MKLKREHLGYTYKLPSLFKRLSILTLLLISSHLSAQEVSVFATDPTGSEVTVPVPENTITFTFSHTGLATAITVNYTVSGSATPIDDFTSLTGSTNLISGSAIIPALGNSVDIVLSGIVDDDLVELPETVIVTISSVSGGFGAIPSPTNNNAEATINDNDVGVVSFDTASASFISSVSEDGTLQLPVEFGQFRPMIDKANGTAAPLTVTYAISGSSTATNGVDYTLTNAVVLTFDNNGAQVVRNIRVAPMDDLFIEQDETITLTLISTSNPLYTIGTQASATVTIVDNDVCAAGTLAPILDNEPTEFCDVPNVDLNTFYSGVTAAGITLRWSLVPTPTTTAQLLTIPAAAAAAAGTYYSVFWSNAEACASPASVPLVITINDTPSSGTPIATISEYCNNADPSFTPRSVDLDNLITGEDPGTWVADPGNPSTVNIIGNNVVNFDNKLAGTYDFTYTTTGALGACVNSSTTISITVKDCDLCASIPAPTLNSTQTVFCGPIPDTVELNDYAANNSPAPDSFPLTWAFSSTDPLGTIVPSTVEQNPGPGTYYGFYLDAGSACTTPPTVSLTLAMKPLPEINTTNGAERCGPGIVTLTATVSINATINWYASETSTTILDAGPSFEPNVNQTTTYWVEATLNDCASEREAVVAIVVLQPSAGDTLNDDGISSACSDENNGPTIVDLDDLITGEDAGGWVYTNGPLGQNITIPSNNIIDFENTLEGDYIFTYTTTGAQAPCSNESTVVTISVNDCDVDSDLDGLFDGPEATLGTNPNNPDSDNDGISDFEEVGGDINNPLDEDEDGMIDALESNVLDADMDGVVDQLDPANTNPCIPNTLNGVCDSDEDDITDSEEVANGTDPLDACDPNPDHPNCNPLPIDLEVLKEVDNINAQVGDDVVFTITVRNTDPVRKAKNIIVGDLLESGFEYVSHEAGPAENYDPLTGEWSVPEILPAEEAILKIIVTIVEGGTYVNTAELLDSFPMDDTLANNQATVTLPIVIPEGIDLALEKTALSPNPLVNDEVIFTLKVINQSIDELPVTNIEVEDLILEDNGFVYIDHNTLNGTYDSSTGIWAVESLAKGQEVILEIRVSVPNEGIFTNTAQIVRSSPGDSNPENNEASAEVEVNASTPVDIGIIYNQFSPNGDGTNDILKINFYQFNDDGTRGSEISIQNRIYNIQIFNRYGNLVFEANNKSDSEVWDGTWKGKDAPDGTYFYTMSIQVGNGPELKKGWIQLIR